MAPPAPGKYALVLVFAACSAFGAWATLGHLATHGLGDALEAVLDGRRAALAGGPEPFKRRYLGLRPPDRLLGTLVALFSAAVDGAVPGESALAYAWCMAQFAAGWAVVLLESLRVGNRGRAASRLVVFGLLVQTCTWTAALPLYLALHLLTSPVARLANGDGPAARRALFAFLWDMALLPTSVTLTLVLPAVLMSMPTFLAMSPASHYKIIALCHLFPLLNVVAQAALHEACHFAFGSLRPADFRGRPSSLGLGYLAAVSGVYQFALSLCTLVHAPLLALSLAPPSLRALLAAAVPAGYADLIRRATFANVFVPASPWAAPTVDPEAYASGDLAPLAVHFLRYDILVASVPFLLWAAYLHQTTVKSPGLARLAARVGFWLLVGGVTAPVVALLWDRDEVVLQDESAPPGREKKTK